MAKKINGILKYLKSGQLVTDWGEGNFLALKFTNNKPETVKTIKVGLDPSQGSGLVPLDEDMNGVFKITDKDAQKFIVESYNENNELSQRDEYDLSNLICLEPQYIYESTVIIDGGEYESNYFVAPKAFTVSGVSEDDVISLGFEVRTPVLSVSGSYSEGVYSGAISGVNVETQDYNVSVKVNDTVVCTFVIKGRPAEVPKLTISEASKEVEVSNLTGGMLDSGVTGTEATVSSFDIVGEGVNIESVTFDSDPDRNSYEINLTDTMFTGIENGTYNLTLKANMSDETTLTDTFTLTLNIEGPEEPVEP